MTPTKVSQRPLFRVHYRKLVEDNSSNGIYSGNSETITFIPPLSVPEYLSYCCRQCGHQQEIKTEELKSIVGNAFRVAYANHWKNQQYLRNLLTDGLGSLSTRIRNPESSQNEKCSRQSTDCADRRFPKKSNSATISRTFEETCPSLAPSATTSDENNSPTGMNTYKKLPKKPSHTKRIQIRTRDALQEGLPKMRPTPEGCPSSQKENFLRTEKELLAELSDNFVQSLQPSSTVNCTTKNSINTFEFDLSYKDVNRVTNSTTKRRKVVSGGSTSKAKKMTRPQHSPSLSLERVMKYREENELKLAPWFQAGIPREITLEVLNEEPIGAFMVRESTTKSGCYALSLRVPDEYHPRGIAHYLIIKTKKGYKIKGFTKEFSTLTALITHHSVMQELLPCPLSLSKYNPSFTKSDSEDFEDIDSDLDNRTLADLRKMMMDLNI